MTNRNGKDQGGDNIFKSAKASSKKIADDYKKSAAQTKADMQKFHDTHVDPSSAPRIAEAIISAADHLEAEYHESEEALGNLFLEDVPGHQGWPALAQGSRPQRRRV